MSISTIYTAKKIIEDRPERLRSPPVVCHRKPQISIKNHPVICNNPHPWAVALPPFVPVTMGCLVKQNRAGP